MARLFAPRARPLPREARLSPKVAEYLPDPAGYLRVAGVFMRQDVIAKVGVGRRSFELVAEPSNGNDPNAVKVLCRGRHIGYLFREDAPIFSRLVLAYLREGRGTRVRGQVLESEDGYSARINVPHRQRLEALLAESEARARTASA